MTPIFALLLLAAVQNSEEKMFSAVRGAIWADLELNAIIGNGNWPASLWYNAGSSETPNLHIQNLACDQRGHEYRCTFKLFRDGGRVEVLGEQAPDELSCRADLNADPESPGTLVVKHLPPSLRGGYSKTTLTCG